MPNIFEALRNDHDRQRELVEATVETSGNSAERRGLFARLQVELQIHADHEERSFYVPLMLDDLTQEKARHSVAEHKELDDLVEVLIDTDMSSPHWLPAAQNLKDRLLHHLDEEEHEVFQLAGKALTEKQKTELGREYQSAVDAERSASPVAK